jgi:glycosyltransferase involved in cell wall biosynthesis
MPDVVLPVLDEALALPRVLALLPVGYRPIVVDNGSKDRSAEIATRLGARVVMEPRRGFGAACYAGLRAATADVVCFMDCDGSLDPRELPLVADPVLVGDVDLVPGARSPRDGPVSPPHARMANRVIAALVHRRCGVRLTDLGPMRAGRRDGLLALGLTDRRYGWPLEMVLRAHAARWRIAEVPVTYGARVGRSKVTGTLRGSLLATFDMARAFR